MYTTSIDIFKILNLAHILKYFNTMAYKILKILLLFILAFYFLSSSNHVVGAKESVEIQLKSTPPWHTKEHGSFGPHGIPFSANPIKGSLDLPTSPPNAFTFNMTSSPSLNASLIEHPLQYDKLGPRCAPWNMTKCPPFVLRPHLIGPSKP